MIRRWWNAFLDWYADDLDRQYEETFPKLTDALSAIDPLFLPGPDLTGRRSNQATETPDFSNTRSEQVSNRGWGLREGSPARKTGVGHLSPLQTRPSGPHPQGDCD